MNNDDISSSGFVTKEEKETLENFFYDIKEIETKGYSNLYIATCLGKKHILKGIKPEHKNEQFYKDLLKKEFEISHSLEHQNIVKTIDFQNIPDIGDCIVMEYVDGMTLREFSEKIKTTDNKNKKSLYNKIFNELLDAMDCFHSRQIIHRDLKPDNILITNNGNNVKIIDFGLSDTDDYVALKQAAGTRKYASPEQIVPDKTIDCRADIYSLGIILKNYFPKSYHKIAERCAQQDREKRFSSANEIRTYIKKKKVWKITLCFSIILTFLFILSFFITKHYLSGKTYNIDEKEILKEASHHIDSQIEIIKDKIAKGPTSNLDEYNELVGTWRKLTASDYKIWTEKIPSDVPFKNDFITYYNTYCSEKIKDVATPYIDWTRESFELIFNNLEPGEELVSDPENPVLFRIQ